MTMYAIASVLNNEENIKVHDIWDGLQSHCQLNAVKVSPIPHFSWFTYINVNSQSDLEHELCDWATIHAPIKLQVNGLGIFPGEKPVLYLPIVRTLKLSAYHFDLIQKISPYIEGTATFYGSDSWIPHVTLAIHDLNNENIDCAVKQCLKHSLSFDLYVDHIAILYLDELTFGLKRKFDFNERAVNLPIGGIPQ
jgi:hypothetical protein